MNFRNGKKIGEKMVSRAILWDEIEGGNTTTDLKQQSFAALWMLVTPLETVHAIWKWENLKIVPKKITENRASRRSNLKTALAY